jgi:hypothetical protein
METCSFCSGNHDSRGCEEKGKTPKPESKCANCGGRHPAWSPHCSTRKEAYLQLEAARNNRPHTHREAGAPFTAETTDRAGTPTSSNNTQVAAADEEFFPALTAANRLLRSQAPTQKEVDKGRVQRSAVEKRGRSTRKEGRLVVKKRALVDTATKPSSQLESVQHSSTIPTPSSLDMSSQVHAAEEEEEQQTQNTTALDVDMSE